MFPFYTNYPGTDLHEIDLAYILKLCAELRTSNIDLTTWKAQHETEYAALKEAVDGLINNLVDVISPWDSSIAYHIFSIVEYQGTNYIAVQDVPVGAMITNTDYWQPANTVVEQINAIGVVTSETAKLPEKVYPRRKYYRPEDYGAVIDDNTIDNAPFIKQAILDANTNGGIVLLSAGTYYTNTEIKIDTHLYGVRVIGTGETYANDNIAFGTIIRYTGNGIALHFTNGIWGCEFERFTIICTGADSTGLQSDMSDDATLTARTHRCIFRNISCVFRNIGAKITNSAYAWFEHCTFYGNTDYNDTGRKAFVIGDETVTGNKTEYLTMMDCRFVPRVFSSTAPSYGIYQTQGVHVYSFGCDITDCDYGWYIITSEDTGFVHSYDLDIARVHKGVYVNINGHSLQNTIFEQTVYTSTSDDTENDRVMVFYRTVGGQALNAKFKAYNTTIRTGQSTMTYWVEEVLNPSASIYVLAPGDCEFTFSMNEVPKIYTIANRQIDPNFSTLGFLTTETTDFDTIKTAGLYKNRLNATSANSPGFTCMLLVYANPAYSVQIAIPLGTSGVNTFAWRVYTQSSDTWSTWANLAKQ